MWPFKSRDRNPAVTEIEQSWAMYQGERDGKPLIARANRGLKPYVGHPSYSHQLGVVVLFHRPDANGFPPSDEAAELMDIEDKISLELEAGNESLFAAVITTGGMREFVFYTSDPKSVETKLKTLKEAISSHSIQGVIIADKKWEVYRQFD